MSNQMFPNSQNMLSYGNPHYDNLRREADQERLIRQVEGDKSRDARALAPISVALTRLLVAAVVLL